MAPISDDEIAVLGGYDDNTYLGDAMILKIGNDDGTISVREKFDNSQDIRFVSYSNQTAQGKSGQIFTLARDNKDKIYMLSY